ncbi:MAG: hypothetical protein HY247_04975 [archaeon]|nr:MAG: hypothetical protein HY247_04975 [archaeon]
MERLKTLFSSRRAKVLAGLFILSMVGTATASVYVYDYASFTSTVRAADVTIAAGSDSSGSCTVYPCATVTVSGTSDTATVTMSLFKADATFSPPPATYYSNLVQVKDATNTHSIKGVTILGISDTRAADFGSVTVYYCTVQTDFNADGTLVTPANCVGSLTFTSTTGGSVSGTFPVSITAGSTQYVEVVAYAGSGGTVVTGDTISFKVAVQWT